MTDTTEAAETPAPETAAPAAETESPATETAAAETPAPEAETTSAVAETPAAEPATSTSTADIDGEPSKLPPAAPGASLRPPPAVVALDKFNEDHIQNSVYSLDTELHNKIHHIMQALRALLHLKAEA
jgi:hypothetical protein